MKALVSLVLAIVLIGGIYLISTSGCGARAQVAGEQLLEKIDSWLGELDVKRKAIENEKKNLEQAIENVREQKVKAKVQLDLYQAKIDPMNMELTNIKRALGELQPHLDLHARPNPGNGQHAGRRVRVFVQAAGWLRSGRAGVSGIL